MRRKLKFYRGFVICCLLFVISSCDNPLIQRIVEPRTATFESNGGSGVESQIVFKGQTVKRPSDPSRSGYSFAAWYRDNETFLEEWDFDAVPNKDITLYAKWIALAETFTVTFDKNGGDTDAQPASRTVETGSLIAAPVPPARADFNFAGWYTEAECITIWNFDEDTVTANITLYAKWEFDGDPVITSAAITVISPIANAAPNTTATTAGNFTVSAVTWTPAAATFAAGTQYTASVTLTAKTWYSFAEAPDITATVNGYTATVTHNSGNTVTISYQFGPTPDVTGISIKTQPHLVYTHGDTLNLSALVVTLTYGIDAHTEDVPFAAFAGKNISESPVDGTTLVCVTHDNTKVRVSIGSFWADTNPLIVNKAVPAAITWPVASAITYPAALSASTLTGGSTTGTWVWQSGSTVPIVANSGYNVVFTPTDTNNYDWTGVMLTKTVAITVNPAPIATAAVTIGAPTKGGTPVTTASIPGGSSFGGGTVTWSPNHSTFQPETAYTATVTLTANTNYTFTGGLTTRTINGNNATTFTNNGSTATLSYQFAALPDADGTAEYPFLVNDEDDLRKVGKGTANPEGYKEWTLSAHYRQTANITLTQGDWTRIGTFLNADSFTGTYNGNGHTITGLTINASVSGQGMFGYIGSGGRVENLGLINVNISCSVYVGGIVGYNNGGTIQNCYVDGSVTGNQSVGGIAGNASGPIQNCYVIGSVAGTGTLSSGVGGIAGNELFDVSNCIALNQSVTMAGTQTTIGRVTGIGGENCYAWKSMTLENDNGPVTATSNPDSKHGADITAVEAKTQAAWQTAGFTFTSDSPWVWNTTYSRPVLRNEVAQAWPAYLFDPLIIDPIAAQTYSGSAITPAVTVKAGGTTLTQTTHYTVTYSNNTNAGTATVTVTGVGVYAGSTGSANFTINKADPTVTWPTGLTATYGQTLSAISLPGNGTSTPGGSFTWTTPSTSVGSVGTQSHSMTFTPTNTNYNTVTQNVNITVSKANPTVTWPTGLTATYGQTLSNISLPGNGTSTPGGSFTWTTPSTSVGNVGTQSHNMTFTPTDTTNYNTLTQNVNITVNKATGAAVSAPTTPPENITVNSVTLNAVTAPANGQTVEYAYNTSSTAPTNGWQVNRTFSGLTGGTTYYFFARSAESNNYNTGAASTGTAITTTQNIGITITLDASDLEEKAPTLENTLILSRSGTGGNSKTASVAVTGTYQSISWQILGMGNVSGTGSPITLNAEDVRYNSLGYHTVSVTVTVNGMQYQTNFRFRIVE